MLCAGVNAVDNTLQAPLEVDGFVTVDFDEACSCWKQQWSWMTGWMLESTDAFVIQPEANDSVTAPLELDSSLHRLALFTHVGVDDDFVPLEVDEFENVGSNDAFVADEQAPFESKTDDSPAQSD